MYKGGRMALDLKARYAKLLDTAALIIESGNEGCTIYEIMKEIGAKNRSSAFNVIETLEEMGFALYQDKSSKNAKMTVYKISSENATKWKRNLLDSALSQDDIRFLNFIFETVSSSTPLMNMSGKSFLSRLKMVLSSKKDNFNPQLSQSGSYFNIGSEYFDTLLTLLEASSEKIKCHLRYESVQSERIVEYDIYPEKVVTIDGAIYALVYNNYGSFQMLALQRIIEIQKIRKEKYPISNAFAEYREDPFPFYQTEEEMKVSVLIDNEQAWYEVQRAWPKSVSFSLQDDGSYLFCLTTKSLYGLTKWVLSMGRKAKIIEPEGVKEYVKQELDAMREQYN